MAWSVPVGPKIWRDRRQGLQSTGVQYTKGYLGYFVLSTYLVVTVRLIKSAGGKLSVVAWSSQKASAVTAFRKKRKAK